MSQAEIKTKLTADGSELSRALDQGIRKASDFRTQISNLGRTIGAAFTFNAVINGLRSWAAEQEANIRTNKELRDSARLFNNALDDMNQRLGNAESAKAYGKVLLDFEQRVKAAKDAVKDFSEIENASGPAGFFKWLGDAKESLVNGGEINRGDRMLIEAIKQAGEAEKAYRAAKRARSEFEQELARKAAKDERTLLATMESKTADEAGRAAFEKMLSTGSADSIENIAKQLSIFSEDTRKNLEAGHGQAAGMAEQIHMASQWAKEAAARAAELRDAAANVELGAGFSDQSAARNLLMGFLPQQSERFSSLRRIGANELGSGVSVRENPAAIADRLVTKVNTKLGEVGGNIVDAVRKIMTGHF